MVLLKLTLNFAQSPRKILMQEPFCISCHIDKASYPW